MEPQSVQYWINKQDLLKKTQTHKLNVISSFLFYFIITSFEFLCQNTIFKSLCLLYNDLDEMIFHNDTLSLCHFFIS